MARQLGIIRVTRAVGNVVGYRMNTSSKNNGDDFLRQKATVVSNPRTAAQARQRAKARPAQMFYQALEPVLNHAFFPTQKAIKNRNRFLAKAMALPQIPDIMKGVSVLPVLPYQVSEGSLGVDFLVKGENVSTYANASQIMFGLVGDQDFTSEEATVAHVSEKLLLQNPSLSEGEELTFLYEYLLDSDTTARVVGHFSFVLDRANTLTVMDDVIGGGVYLASHSISNGSQHRVIIDANNGKLLAAALIISSKSKTSWQYTNSYMCVTDYAKNNLLASEGEVIESYMSADASRDSDKILQQADNINNGSGEVTIASVALESIPTPPAGTLNHATAAVATMSNGTRRIVVGVGALLDTPNTLQFRSAAGSYEGITVSAEGGSMNDVKLADTGWAGNQTISVSEVIAAGF